VAVRPARARPVDRVPQAGRPASDPIRCSGRVRAGAVRRRVQWAGCGPRARAAEPMRSHPTHQPRCPHLRGTSGFRGNFGQLGLPRCSATAGCSAVNSGSRNRGPSAAPAGWPMGPAGRPGHAHSRGNRPGTARRPGARPALSRPGIPQYALRSMPGRRHRSYPAQGPSHRDPAHPRHRSHHANKPGARPSPFSFCGGTRQFCQHPAWPSADHRSHDELVIIWGGPGSGRSPEHGGEGAVRPGGSGDAHLARDTYPSAAQTPTRRASGVRLIVQSH
jgi:hypothetical protein